jgi:hypothetical protein
MAPVQGLTEPLGALVRTAVIVPSAAELGLSAVQKRTESIGTAGSDAARRRVGAGRPGLGTHRLGLHADPVLASPRTTRGHRTAALTEEGTDWLPRTTGPSPSRRRPTSRVAAIATRSTRPLGASLVASPSVRLVSQGATPFADDGFQGLFGAGSNPRRCNQRHQQGWKRRKPHPAQPTPLAPTRGKRSTWSHGRET